MIYNELVQRGTQDFPIELYHVDRFHTRYEMSAHWHGEIELVRVISGELDMRLNNNVYKVKENEIIFINPETVHQASPRDCVYESIVFNTDLIPTTDIGPLFLVDSLKNHEYIIEEYHKNLSSAYSKAINKLFSVMKSRSSGYKFKVIGALYELFGEIVDSHMFHPTESAPLSADRNVPKIRAVLSYIRNNYDSAITLGDMAETAGMSPKYFCYFFKEMTTKTPVEYLNSYRIEKASRKLLNTDMSVTAVAFSCGFNDLSYFIKTFKAIKGITPAKYRKGL